MILSPQNTPANEMEAALRQSCQDYSAHCWMYLRSGHMLLGHIKEDDSFGSFSGRIEAIDRNPRDGHVAAIEAACREVKEETREVIHFSFIIAERIKKAIADDRYFRHTDSSGKNHWHFFIKVRPYHETHVNIWLSDLNQKLRKHLRDDPSGDCDSFILVPRDNMLTHEMREQLHIRQSDRVALDYALDFLPIPL